jgi:hypothetical protein
MLFFYKFMCSYEAKMINDLNNLFKQQFLMHPSYVLLKINVVK